MSRYGVPYMGSKNGIAEKIVDILPKATHFYDLFAGGCAITHCAMEKGKYETYLVNDIGDAPRLFYDAIMGKFKNESRWISREMFFDLKDIEPYVKYCWSFGNNGAAYLYSRGIEPYKKAMYEVCFASTPYERKVKIRSFVKELTIYLKTQNGSEQNLLLLESLQRLKRLQSLQSLERLECLQSLEVIKGDYQNVKIKPCSIIYCDIPYKGTAGYANKETEDGRYRNTFDYERFYTWCEKQTEPVFISEYNMPNDRFECIFEIKKRVTLSQSKTNYAIEKLFIPKTQSDKIKKLLREQKGELF